MARREMPHNVRPMGDDRNAPLGGGALLELFPLRRVVLATGTGRRLIELRGQDKVYSIGEMVYSAQSPNFVYVASAVAGDFKTENAADDGTHPTWPLVVGATVVDDQVTWTCLALTRRYALGFGLAAKKEAGDNADKVYVGTDVVDKTDRQQIELAAGEFLRMTDLGFPPGNIVDLTTIWVDAATNADEVTGTYVPPPTI